MNRQKTALGWRGALVLVLGAVATLPACSDDPDDPPPGTGGKGGGTGGSPATGGKLTTGGAPTTGGKPPTGGTAGTGGIATGGRATGGTDGGDDDGGACKAPSVMGYNKPGCGGTVAPVCSDGAPDACAETVCACDGKELSGCGFYAQPWRHLGSCADSGRDSGPDAD
jgi:hypothetical protein